VNSMKLRFLVMGTILIILSIALIAKRYSPDDFILTTAGVILLAVGIVWKNTETQKVVPPNSTS
jgi:predicted membrane channel-forming protein YqfA (hemolysin III family)